MLQQSEDSPTMVLIASYQFQPECFESRHDRACSQNQPGAAERPRKTMTVLRLTAAYS